MARLFRLDSNTMVIPSQNGAMIGCNRSRQHLKSTGFLHTRTGCRACGVRVQCIQSSPLPHAVAAWQPTARVMCPFMCPLHTALLLGSPGRMLLHLMRNRGIPLSRLHFPAQIEGFVLGRWLGIRVRSTQN